MNNTTNNWKKGIPKYYQLKQLIINDIKSKVYRPNSKLPSQNELMKKYSISIGTIDKTVNELVNEGYIYTIQGKGRFVLSPDVEPKRKKNVNGAGNKKIIYIAPRIVGDEYYSKIHLGILDVVQSKGYELVSYNSECQYQKETEILSRYIENPPAGILFMPLYYDMSYKHLFYLKKRGVPVVLIARKIKDYELDWVGLNVKKSTMNAVKYLIKLGHKRIALLGMSDRINWPVLARFEGYKQALKDKRIKLDKNLILDINADEENISTSGYKGLKRALSEGIKFTAIFVFDDWKAISIYNILKERGIRVPEDVSIVGFDDIDLAQHFEVPLTTIRQDIYHVGYSAAKLLLKKIDNSLYKKPEILDPDKIEEMYIPTKLIIRDSTRDIRKSTQHLEAANV